MQMTGIVIALVVGLPLAIVGLASLGLVGWIIAAVRAPDHRARALLWIGRERHTPGTRDEPR